MPTSPILPLLLSSLCVARRVFTFIIIANSKQSKIALSSLLTKYVYLQSTTVYVLVPSSELGFSHPSLASECAPPPGTCGRGVGGVPIPTTGEKVRTLPTLCLYLFFSDSQNKLSALIDLN
jgi:hypothetical protein